MSQARNYHEAGSKQIYGVVFYYLFFKLTPLKRCTIKKWRHYEDFSGLLARYLEVYFVPIPFNMRTIVERRELVT
jgi:hypothetical protein